MTAGNPIDGEPLLVAAATGSVDARRLSPLLDRVQAALADRVDDYRRGYELAHETDDCWVFFVESGHWETVGAELDLDRREADAARRAHRRHLLFGTDRDGRREEFETALDVREVVVVGKP